MNTTNIDPTDSLDSTATMPLTSSQEDSIWDSTHDVNYEPPF